MPAMNVWYECSSSSTLPLTTCSNRSVRDEVTPSTSFPRSAAESLRILPDIVPSSLSSILSENTP